MSTFAIIMFAATGFFAYQIYRHVQSLEDRDPQSAVDVVIEVDPMELIEEADEAYKNGDLQTAKSNLQNAFELLPNEIEVINKLAFVLGKLGETQEAIRLCSLSLEKDNTNDLTHNAIASLYRAQGSLELAREHYDKALQIDDTYAVTYFNYGNLWEQMGEAGEAEKMYLKAIELDSEFQEARKALQGLRGEG